MKINARSVHSGLSALLRARRVDARPLHLHIEPTNFCNYDCVMCVHKTAIAKPAHLPLELFEKIIDEAQPWYVSLNGYGEPLMCPHFFDMVRALTRRGIRCNTTTNGSLLFPIVLPARLLFGGSLSKDQSPSKGGIDFSTSG